jgi:predicted nucleic acid-binding protein
VGQADGPGPETTSTFVTTFADTNVWVYAFDRADPSKRRKAAAALAAEPVVVSTQVMSEFFVVVTRKLAKPLSTSDAHAVVREMARLQVVSIDAALVDAAIEGAEAWGISYWDALIVRAAEAAGCDRILSEDLEHGQRLGSIVVRDPFA